MGCLTDYFLAFIVEFIGGRLMARGVLTGILIFSLIIRLTQLLFLLRLRYLKRLRRLLVEYLRITGLFDQVRVILGNPIYLLALHLLSILRLIFKEVLDVRVHIFKFLARVIMRFLLHTILQGTLL